MKKKKAFVTGIAGFAGSYLAELLLREGCQVYGLLAPKEKSENIEHIKNELNLERFDILNQNRLSNYIKKAKPNYIFHLAALASVAQSFSNEATTHRINIDGTLNVLHSAVENKNNLTRLVFVSSSDVYGYFKPYGKTLREDQKLNPVSPYAISKTTGEFLVKYYFKSYKIPGVIIRSFNHTGPKQNENFVVPAFCKQVAEIEKGKKKPILLVGDLSARRDLSDVRDIVRGYYLSAIKGKAGDVYQLCSGKSIAIRKMLEKLLRMSDVPIKVKVDRNRLRKTDIPVLRGDYQKAKRLLGWMPKYKFETTIWDTLQYWREKIKT